MKEERIAMNQENKRRLGLTGLYVLLLITSSLVQQAKYIGIPVIFLLAGLMIALVILWKNLLRKKIIRVTWASMTYESNPNKSERLFLFGLVTLMMPVLRIRELTVSDLILSLLALVIGGLGFALNERRLNSKIQKQGNKKQPSK